MVRGRAFQLEGTELGKRGTLDATHTKVHQGAANPAGRPENQRFGRTKGGLSTKLTALVDNRGRALQLTLAPGSQADVRAPQEIVLPQDRLVIADKGYDSDPFCQAIAAKGGRPGIPFGNARKIFSTPTFRDRPNRRTARRLSN